MCFACAYPAFVCADGDSYSSEFGLKMKGYTPGIESVKKILKDRTLDVLYDALGYIADENYVQLIPDVHRYEKGLNVEEYSDREEWYATTRCLLKVDKNMSEEELVDRVELLRVYAFRKKGERSAYDVLLVAQEYKGVDIKADLLQLARPGDPSPALKHLVIDRLFDLYGGHLDASEVDDLRKAWQGSVPGAEKIRLAFDLLDRGYHPTVAGMQEILRSGDRQAASTCLSYIRRTRSVGLTHFVRRFMKQLNPEEKADWKDWLAAAECRFATDTSMSVEDTEKILEVIRRHLFQGEGDAGAYEVLVALHARRDVGRVVDVKSDFLRLARPGNPLSDMKERIVGDLFEQYGPLVRPEELADLKRAWEGNDKMIALIGELDARSRTASPEQRERLQRTDWPELDKGVPPSRRRTEKPTIAH
jgi:hypothetical protein